MSPRPPQGAGSSSNMYIPAGAQAALARQMQQSVPAHLQKYTGPNAGYVPPRAQAELTAHMQAALPGHLQQYAGAYVEQNVVNPSFRPPVGQAATSPATFRPVRPVNPRSLSHSGAVGSEQADGMTLLNHFQETAEQRGGSSLAASSAPAPLPASGLVQPQPTEGQIAPPSDNYGGPTVQNGGTNHENFGFIMNPQAAPKRPGSFGKRLAIVVGGGGLLLIALLLVVSSLTKPNPQASLLAVAQAQTELLRIAGTASAQTKTPAVAQLAGSVNINIQSAQNQTLAQMAKNKQKTTPKLLGATHSAQTDTVLNNAVATSTFDTAFLQVMQQQLTDYSKTLKTVYDASTGHKAKTLLKQQYDGAQLLAEQATQK